jgi:outer membrane lipoprotein LolB
MKITVQAFWVMMSLLVLVTGCQMQNGRLQHELPYGGDSHLALENLKDFRVGGIDLDYIADCKVRIKTREKSYSGSCKIALTRNHELHLTVSHPLGGVLIELYADSTIIQINDYSEKRFIEINYREKKRINLPIIRDVSIIELQAILWGRVTPRASETLDFIFTGEKPAQLVKTGMEAELATVYKSWLQYQEIEFPRILEVSNSKEKTSVKLAITRFYPGVAGDLKLKKRMMPVPSSENH